MHLATNFLQLDRNVFDVLVTLVRIFSETTTHYTLQVRGRARIVSRERCNRLANDLVQDVDLILTGKSFPAGDGFKQNAAKRKDVGTVVDLLCLALRLFGRHVPERAENQSGR